MAVALAVLSRTDSCVASCNVLTQLESRSTVNMLADLQRRGALDDADIHALLDSAPSAPVTRGMAPHHDVDLWWTAQTLRHLLDACALLRAHEAIALSPVDQPVDHRHEAGARATAASLLAGMRAATARRALLTVALQRVTGALEAAMARVQHDALQRWLVATSVRVLTSGQHAGVPEAVLEEAAAARRVEDPEHGDAVQDAAPVLTFFTRMLPQLHGALRGPEGPTAAVLEEWSFRMALTAVLKPYTTDLFPTTEQWRYAHGCTVLHGFTPHVSWTPLLAHLQVPPWCLLQQCMVQGQYDAAVDVALRHSLPGAQQAHVLQWLVTMLRTQDVDQGVDHVVDFAACPHPVSDSLEQLALLLDVAMLAPVPCTTAARVLHQALQQAVRVEQPSAYNTINVTQAALDPPSETATSLQSLAQDLLALTEALDPAETLAAALRGLTPPRWREDGHGGSGRPSTLQAAQRLRASAHAVGTVRDHHPCCLLRVCLHASMIVGHAPQAIARLVQATQTAEQGKQRYLSAMLHTLSKVLLAELPPADPEAVLLYQGYTPCTT